MITAIIHKTMATFQLKTEKGQTHTFKARSWSDANEQAHYICSKDQDRRVSMTTIKVEKEKLPEAVLAGHEMVRQMMMSNPDVSAAMDLVESSYIKYWQEQRNKWIGKTEAEINEIFPMPAGQRWRDRGREYYGSIYYKLKTEGALTDHPAYYETWLNMIKKEAFQAKDKSINNMIHAIVKIAKNAPITFFKVISIKRGKDGLDGVIKVNDIIKRVYAIYASGPVQCLHIRYLIK